MNKQNNYLPVMVMVHTKSKDGIFPLSRAKFSIEKSVFQQNALTFFLNVVSRQGWKTTYLKHVLFF